MLQKTLLEYYEGEEERVGFVLSNDAIIEVDNIAEDKKEGFDVSSENILHYLDDAVATWHTHPNSTSNLSVGDFETFLNWPNQRHYIVGNDGVQEYYVEDGEVLIA